MQKMPLKKDFTMSNTKIKNGHKHPEIKEQVAPKGTRASQDKKAPMPKQTKHVGTPHHIELERPADEKARDYRRTKDKSSY